MFPAGKPTLLTRRKKGRFQGTGDKDALRSKDRRQQPDCYNSMCVQWHACRGGTRKNMCPAYNIQSTYLSKAEAQKQRRAFLRFMTENPNLGAETAAMFAMPWRFDPTTLM